MMMKRRQRGSRSTIHLVALLAVLAVPAVSWALPQNTTAKPPGMAGGGGGDPTAAEPYGPPVPPTRAADPAAPDTEPAAQPRAVTAPPAAPTSRPAAPATRPVAPAAPRAAAEPAPEPMRAPLISPPRIEAPRPAAVAPATPASGANVGASVPTTAAKAEESVEKLMAEGAATAAALHGAIAVRDWEAAQRENLALRDVLARMREPDLRAPALAERVARLQRLTPLVSGAIARRDAFRANDTAYRLVYGLVDAITLQAATRGGGGGAPAPAAPVVVPPPVDHLRQGYPEVMKAHAALLRGEPTEAKAHLDAVREQLQAALKAKPGAIFARRLDGLNKARWRVVAALGDPARSQRLSIALTRAYAEAVHAVGQYATIGGGGGATARPRSITGIPARTTPTRSLRAIQRPARERNRGADAVPYDKRGT